MDKVTNSQHVPDNGGALPEKKGNRQRIGKLIFRTLKYFFLGITGLILILLLALQFPWVQTQLARFAMKWLKNNYDINAHIERVEINFLSRTVRLKNIMVEDHMHDTLIVAQALNVDVGELNFNNSNIVLSTVMLDRGFIQVCTYKKERKPNITFLIDKFKPKETVPKKKPVKNFIITMQDLSLNECRVRVKNMNQQARPAAFLPNDIQIGRVSGNISQFDIRGDSLLFKVKNLRAWEQSGLVMSDFKANVLICSTEMAFSDFKLKTPHSQVSGYYAMRYRNWSSLGNFIDSVTLVTDLNLSNIDLKDIAFFTDELKGIDLSIRIKGHVKGPISNLKGKNLSIYLGSVTQLDGDIALQGLPDFKNTMISLHVKKLVTQYYDLRELPVPPFSTGKKIQVPAEIVRLGVMKFSGRFDGFYNNFTAYGMLETQAGSAKTDITMDVKGEDVMYKGSIKLMDFNAGKVFNMQKTLGNISFSGTVEGKNFSLDKLSTLFDGTIHHLDFNGYRYTNINTSAYFKNKIFNGKVGIKDPNIALDFSGIINLQNNKLPEYDFNADVKYANLKNLLLVKTDSLSIVSGEILANFAGSNIDELVGSIHVNKLFYKASPSRFLNVDSLTLFATLKNDSIRSIIFDSPLIQANVDGTFRLIPLWNDIKIRINQIFPSFNLPVDHKIKSVPQQFVYNISFIHPNSIFKVFFPELQMSSGNELTGIFHSPTNTVSLTSNTIGWLRYKNIKMQNWNILVNNKNKKLELTSNASALYFGDSIKIDNVILNANANNDTLKFWTGFYNKGKKQNSASINAEAYIGKAPRFEFRIFDSYFYFNDSLWTISDRNKIVLDSAYLYVENLEVLPKNSRYPMIVVNGETSSKSNLPIRISLNDFPMDFTDFFLTRQNVDLDGWVNGKLELYSIFSKTPYFTSDLSVSDLQLNKIPLGELYLNSIFKSENKEILLNANLKRLGVKNLSITNGRFYPFRENDQLDIHVDIDGLNLSVFKNMVDPVFSDIQGLAFGNVSLSGTTKSPIIESNLNLQNAMLRIGYTNVAYYIRHTKNRDILINNKKIILKDLEITDMGGNKGMVNGVISHKLFNDINLNLQMNFENLNVLETSPRQNEQFYGTAFATGNATMNGPLTDLVLSANITTEKYTILNLPIRNTAQIDEKNFVMFIKSDTSQVEDNLKKKKTINTNFTFNLNAKITPDAECRVIFDETVGDVISASGFSDNISLSIDSKEKFDIYGVFEITRGNYLFTLQNLINKQFAIKPGSTITFSGNPYQAIINATAIYTANTSLYPIVSVFMDPTQAELYRRATRISCELILTNRLVNPTISFNMELPNTDESTKNLIKSTMANENEMNRQVFALLVMNQFLPPESTGGSAGTGNLLAGSLGSGLGSSSLELLAGQLNNWISKLTRDVSLNLKYKAGDAQTADQVNVALSTQFFNQRLIIDGDIGVGGQTLNQSASQNQSQIVGNVTVEFKATNDGRLRLKAFNRSNENNLMKNSAAYTQGVGISYRREFENWKDLFKFIKRNKAKQEGNQEENNDSLKTN
ncbi:MAG: translocation/assembly module TamB domain-containing protein [Flavobacteriales bacterium]|nr:translocation/assembly module TamB domain-containing protein [Flavobacteriales bacterium]